MDFPDSRVVKIVNHLKKELKSGKTFDLTSEIETLSIFQRIQVFCLIQELEISTSEIFPLETRIWEAIHALFRNDYTETSVLIENYDNTLELAEIALLTQLFDLEDYRTIIRFLYTNVEDYSDSLLKLNVKLLHFLRVRKVGVQALPIFSHLLRFLGIPLMATDELKVELLESFPEAKSEIDAFFELPITTMQRYPEYLEEIAEQLNYDISIPILKNWLDHETLFKLEQAKVSHFIESWKPRSPETVDELISILKDELAHNNLTSIPPVFDSFIKPFTTTLKPLEVKSSDLKPNIPPEIIQTYVEKVAYPITSPKDVKIRITFLGGAQIGTMGILISTPQSNILIDYGMSVSNYQIPYWDDALNYLDAILITHAHLDHIGAVPYLYAQGYNGYIFGSGMTKNLANFLLHDNLELMKKNTSNTIRKSDHRFRSLSQSAYFYQVLDRYIPIKTGEEYQLTPDIVIKSFPAHHIQGSVAYSVECDGKNVLFSGDLNLDPMALFKEKSPSLPLNADLTIVDSTYYGQPAFNPAKRDDLLFQTVREDEKVIIPAFSVGRAQEILIKLEKAGLTKERKISTLGMATKVARVSGVKTKAHLSDHLVQPFEDKVVITGGGMLSGGYARELVEQTKEDPNTTIILCGFLAKNTLGNRLLHNLEPSYKQKVVFTRFSGHSSSKTLSKFLNSVKGQKALVHLGSLTTDPFISEKIRNSDDFTHSEYYIPTLGSVLEI
ncbi:MAG: MBL fold metallo-hydrolase [Candidatus Heimdallarchaeota archaeon]|nr:MAG: MBL fold metallo-hydrolase [Candidatus Heimdallarchaeota archaeon]